MLFKKYFKSLQEALLTALLAVINEMLQEETISLADEEADKNLKPFKGNKRFVDDQQISDLMFLEKNSEKRKNHLKHQQKHGEKAYLIKRRYAKQEKEKFRFACYE